MVNYRVNFNKEEKEVVRQLASETGLSPEVAAILFSRGLDSVDKIEYFLDPGKHHFKDPFLLKGMSEAVERISSAKEEGETVLIYGDYDADGISATAVLYYALKEFGIDALKVVPERSDGYGLQKAVLDQYIEDCFPTLIITVDCGISCYKEVQYLTDEGIDVIVTDHHELPDRLPDCTVINCKIPSDYSFDGLCGAGVAYKLAYALIGEKANEFLDFVAIATIADSMPLIGENRDIVFEGVNYIRSGKAHSAINELIAVSNMREVNSTSLAFTIAPRINAAGRMGDARSALELMTSDDHEKIEELAIKLNAYNVSRQSECEKLYKSARQKLVDTAYNKKIVVLCDDEWNSGLVGIIAAKLVEEFSRPVILFVNNDGKLHGSARSIEDINIFEAISSCKECLSDFGGHAQAAGISVELENYGKFVDAIERFVDEKYDYDLFKPKKTVELAVKKPFTIELAKELNRLEPFGTGNRKPQFSVKAVDVKADPIKPSSPHVLIKTDLIELLYFNGVGALPFINSGMSKEFIFEPNVSVFNREASLKGYVKSVDYEVLQTDRIKLNSFRESLLTALSENDDFLYISSDMTKKLVAEYLKNHYGTIFAVYNPDNLKIYEGIDEIDCALYKPTNKNLVNTVVVGLKECDIQGFRRVIYLDRPLGTVSFIENMRETFIDRNVTAFDYGKLRTDKNVFADVFKRAKTLSVRASDSVDFALKCGLNYDAKQIVFVIEVFIELGIFSFRNGMLRHNSEVRSSLDASKIYAEVLKLK